MCIVRQPNSALPSYYNAFNINLNSAKVPNMGSNWPVFGVGIYMKFPNEFLSNFGQFYFSPNHDLAKISFLNAGKYLTQLSKFSQI